MADEHSPLISVSDSPPSLGKAKRSSSSSSSIRSASNSTSTDFLTRFRQAIGINAQLPPSSSSCALYDLESARRSARGLYHEIITAQRQRSRQYQLVDTVYYVALLSNVVIGATLASLGPLSKLHPAAITILGIVNSSTAGILALLKGQGLPDRLRKDGFEMRRVQDFVEQTEIGLACGALPHLNEDGFAALVRDVFDRYDVARDTAEMNRPGSYAHQIETAPTNRSASASASGNGNGNAGSDSDAEADIDAKAPSGGAWNTWNAGHSGLPHGRAEIDTGYGRQSRLAIGGVRGGALAIS